jgi:hypothetical protein
MLSRNATRNIQAVLVLVIPIAAWLLMPSETLMPIAWASVALAIAGVLGIKAYMGRLHAQSRLAGETRILYTEAAMALAMLGLVAFLVLLLEYS